MLKPAGRLQEVEARLDLARLEVGRDVVREQPSATRPAAAPRRLAPATRGRGARAAARARRRRRSARPALQRCAKEMAAAAAIRDRADGHDRAGPQRIGGRVHQAALGPQVVDAARQRHRRLRPEVALEALAVVADLLDDRDRPTPASRPSSLPVSSETPRKRCTPGSLLLGLLLVDIGLRQAVLLGFDHREQGPAHDLEPLVVAAPHRRAERLLRDHLRQDHVVVGASAPSCGRRPGRSCRSCRPGSGRRRTRW